MKELLQKIKKYIPVSRGRYERELSLLRLSVNRTIAEEKQQLDSMIYGLGYVTARPCQNGAKEIAYRMMVTDDLLYFCRNPYQRRRMFFEIAEKITREIEKEFGQ